MVLNTRIANSERQLTNEKILGLQGSSIIVLHEVLLQAEKFSMELQKCNVRAAASKNFLGAL